VKYALEFARENSRPPIGLQTPLPRPAQMASQAWPSSSINTRWPDRTSRAIPQRRLLAAQPSSTSDRLIGLQRHYGNRYVQRLVASSHITPNRLSSTQAQRAPADAGPPVGVPGADNAVSADAPSPGGCPTTKKTPPPDPRVILDNLCLLSSRLKDDSLLNDAFHNNPPLTKKENGKPGPVQKLQLALLDVGEVLPRFGTDGDWGDETIRAVASFQSKNGIQPGGFEAGRKTLLALDAHLQQGPPKPVPPQPTPANAVDVKAQCGQDPQSGRMLVIVTGTGFPPGRIDLTIEGQGGFSTRAETDGKFSGSVPPPANLGAGSHVVEATGGGVHGVSNPVTTPCGQAPPQPTVDPGVTASELLVLAKFQFMHETQRDATEDAIKDLQPLDKVRLPFIVQVLETVATAYIQFEYGAIEQLVRAAILGGANPGNADFLKLVDNGADKAFDFLEDNVKEGVQDELKDEHEAPSDELTKHIEKFRRATLAGLRVQNFKCQRGWIGAMQKDETRNITPVELQAIGDSVEKSDGDIYKAQYDKVIQSWTSYIAQAKVGGTTVTGVVEEGKSGKPRQGEIAVTDLSAVGNKKDAEDLPGVLLIGIEANDGGSLQSDQKLSAATDVGFTRQMIALNDIHIFGLNEQTRNHIQGPLGGLTMPMALRGKPTDGGQVVIGKDEDRRIVDGGSDGDGKKWLSGVSKALGGSGDAQDGMQRLFDRDLKSTVVVPGSIQGP
jgi:hypothetical protein